jgi:hypothetical protein
MEKRMTTEEIEAACDASEPLDFSRHVLDAPETLLRKMYYPMGFPLEIRTNSPEIFAEAEHLWGTSEKRFDTEPILADVHVVEVESAECPPAPQYRIMDQLLVSFADADNYCIADLLRQRSQMTVSTAALRHSSYLRFFFLEGLGGCHIATRYATPVHAGCVALDGRGVLLLGDSGAGKSTLSYACARAGWQYISDDASFLLNCSVRRRVIGNSRQVRLRPTAGELFPEIAGLDITPRAAGKPSIEIPIDSMLSVKSIEGVEVDYLVFLNRHAGEQRLSPYRKDVAGHYMRQVLYGPAEWQAIQYQAIERLLTAEVFELRYSALDWAIDRLETLLREGR